MKTRSILHQQGCLEPYKSAKEGERFEDQGKSRSHMYEEIQEGHKI